MHSVVFFKQKAAYDMRIRDWSSDVCASDLPAFCMLCRYGLEPDTTSSSLYGGSARPAGRRARRKAGTMRKSGTILAIALAGILSACASGPAPVDVTRRSEERRGGKECVRELRSRW